MNAKNYEFPDLTWKRKCIAAVTLFAFGFPVAVFLVTVSIILFVEPVDGRDEFMREVIKAQELNEITKSITL